MMYTTPSLVIVAALLIGTFAAMSLGHRMGRTRTPRDETETGQVSATQASLLGILGLLLGFTFSVSLNRHDDRSGAVVSEANAIGTAWLRADLLPDPSRVKPGLIAYTRERVAASTIPASEHDRRIASVKAAEAQFSQLWSTAAGIAQATPNPASVAFTNALNDMIDELSARDAAIERHVPEIVLIILYATFLLSSGLLGYASGASRSRVTLTALVMPILIVALIYVIIDLDRPRRGLITVNQAPLITAFDAIRTD